MIIKHISEPNNKETNIYNTSNNPKYNIEYFDEKDDQQYITIKIMENKKCIMTNQMKNSN